jgi:hypothetical protein
VARTQVLFFSRLAADVCGRTLPRLKRLAVRSRYLLLGFGMLMSASIPGFLWYIRASPWHNDWAVTGAANITQSVPRFAAPLPYLTFADIEQRNAFIACYPCAVFVPGKCLRAFSLSYLLYHDRASLAVC